MRTRPKLAERVGMGEELVLRFLMVWDYAPPPPSPPGKVVLVV